MRITTEKPNGWVDLQNMVCRFLNDAGYHATTPKTIQTVRGEVEVDVYVSSDDDILKCFICECKNWKTKVPKEKVHAFRMVVHDSGAMLGIMISNAGFQKGAYNAAKCSNVLLKDWDGFIEMISTQWLRRKLYGLRKTRRPLWQFMNILRVPDEVLCCEESRNEYSRLQTKYMDVYITACSMAYGFDIFQNDAIVVGEKSFIDYDSLFQYMEKCIPEALSDFSRLYKQYKAPLPDVEGVEDDYFDFAEVLKHRIAKE